jgi:hypothetical protein
MKHADAKANEAFDELHRDSKTARQRKKKLYREQLKLRVYRMGK